MRISDWSSDVCSSDLEGAEPQEGGVAISLRLVVEPVVVTGDRDELQPVAEFDAGIEHCAASPRRRDADRVDFDFIQTETPARLAIAGRYEARGGERREEAAEQEESGRAACRERVCQYV